MRYERKYRIEQLNWAQVQQIVKQHPAAFRKIYPDRQVNNIYLDTPNCTAYRENVMGIAQRKKYRIRWYGTRTQTMGENRLEIKIKDNELGRKEVYPFPAFQWQDLSKLPTMVAATLGQNQVLQVTLLNAYQRAYYGTSNGHFRITLDRQLRFLPLFHAGTNSSYTWEDQGLILELKYHVDDQTAAEWIQQYLPFRMTKSSKYVRGMGWL